MSRTRLAGLTLSAALIGLSCETPNEATTCPDSRDPRVSYVGGSDRDPAVCATIRFLCAEGTPFSDACGCGCVRN